MLNLSEVSGPVQLSQLISKGAVASRRKWRLLVREEKWGEQKLGEGYTKKGIGCGLDRQDFNRGERSEVRAGLHPNAGSAHTCCWLQ